MNIHFFNRPMPPTAATGGAPSRIDGWSLHLMLADRLMDVALAAEPRVDVDDDLVLMHDIAGQIETICRDILGQLDHYMSHSWLYRWHRVTAWLSFSTGGYPDMVRLDELDDICRRMPNSMANEHHVAQGYTQRGRPEWVRDCRDSAIKGVWAQAARCLQRGDRS